MGSKEMSRIDTIRPEHLILTRPTSSEKLKNWSLSHSQWGAALTKEDYLRREEYLLTVPLSKGSGLTQWILTTSELAPDQRPILSSCESLRKRALVRDPVDGKVIDIIAHGIASVFTDPQFRGKGYASKMMRLLGEQLGRWQGRLGEYDREADMGVGLGTGLREGMVGFSVLYSDIGKSFYAVQGWAPFESTHFTFPPAPEPREDASATVGEEKETAKGISLVPIGYPELAELCATDETLLRAKLANSSLWPGPKARVSLIPDLDTILWHQMREDFMTQHIFGKTSTVKGAVYGKEAKGNRIWAVWSRGYYGGLERIEGNTLYILRLVIEDEGAEEEFIADGIKAIVGFAQAEAREWRLAHVEMWNPTPLVKKLVENSGLKYEFTVREKDGIASLMWYGKGPVDEVEWIAIEKFGWC
jgi:GNAT superfamily N-acetyltransferase